MYGENFKKVMTLEKSCVEIMQQTSLGAYYEILKNVLVDFFHEEPNLFWTFYEFFDRADSLIFGYSCEKEDAYHREIQDFAEKTMNQLQSFTSYSAKKEFVFKKILPKNFAT